MTTGLIIAVAAAFVLAIPLLAARGMRANLSPNPLKTVPAAGIEGRAHPGDVVGGNVPHAMSDPHRDASTYPPQVQRWRDALEDIAADHCRRPFSTGTCVGQERFYWCHPCIASGALDPRFGCTAIDASLEPNPNSLNTPATPLAWGVEGQEARPGEVTHGDPLSVSQGVPTPKELGA